jgi:hypothetical protein
MEIILLIYNNLKNTEFPNFDNRGGNPIKVKRTDFENKKNNTEKTL